MTASANEAGRDERREPEPGAEKIQEPRGRALFPTRPHQGRGSEQRPEKDRRFVQQQRRHCHRCDHDPAAPTEGSEQHRKQQEPEIRDRRARLGD